MPRCGCSCAGQGRRTPRRRRRTRRGCPGRGRAAAGARQLRFRREHDLVRDPGQLAALLVGGPVRGQVQGPADQGVPGRGAQVRVTATWHIAIPPRVPLYWRAAPAQSAGGLGVAGLVHDQHHVTGVLACGKAPGRPVRGGVQHPLVIARGRGTAGAASGTGPGARRPRPWSSSCDPRVPPAGRSPCRGRSDGSPAGRSTARPAPSGHRAGRHARHRLRWRQRLSCDCSVPQTGMITAAASASPGLRQSVTRVLGQRHAPLRSDGRDLQLCHQGHDLQLP